MSVYECFAFRDDMDNSPLHLAAANGYTKSMKLLLQVYPNLLNQTNKSGVSLPLHFYFYLYVCGCMSLSNVSNLFINEFMLGHSL